MPQIMSKILRFSHQLLLVFAGGNSDTVFAMDGLSGRLMLARPLDVTQQHKYVLIVMASDKAQPPNTDTAKVRNTTFILAVTTHKGRQGPCSGCASESCIPK